MRDEILYKFYLEEKEKAEKLKRELEPQLAPIEAQIGEINKKISAAKNELAAIEKKKNSCRVLMANAEKEYVEEGLAYIQAKIRSERTGEKPIVQIDEDEKIIELYDKKQDVILAQQKEIAKYEESMEESKAAIAESKDELKPFKKEFKRISAPLKEAEDARDMWLSEYRSEHAKESNNTSFSYSGSSYSDSSSGSSFSSFVERDSYEKEQAEELKKQTEYARRQAEEARKQTELARRQMEESKRQAERAEREAANRRLEEERRRRQQEEAERREKQREKERAMLRETLKTYQGVVYFRGGRTEKTGTSNSRRLAESMAQQRYDHAMKIAINDNFKPTRYEVIEIYPW